MKHRTSQLLFAYWDELRAGRKAPMRLDVDPSRISGILPETLMIETSAPGSYRFRIAGTKVCEKIGAELRGLNFLALWGASDQRRLEENFQAMSKYGHMTAFPIKSVLSTGAHVQSELLLLPLFGSEGAINRFMGAWSFEQDPVWNSTAYLREHTIDDANRMDVSAKTLKSALLPRFEPPSLVDEPADSRLVTVQRRRFRVYDGGRP